MRITAPFVSNHRNYLRIFLNYFLDAAAIVGNLLLLESHWVFCFHLFLPHVEKLQLLRVQCVEDENASPVLRMRLRASVLRLRMRAFVLRLRMQVSMLRLRMQVSV